MCTFACLSVCMCAYERVHAHVCMQFRFHICSKTQQSVSVDMCLAFIPVKKRSTSSVLAGGKGVTPEEVDRKMDAADTNDAGYLLLATHPRHTHGVIIH
jgi:hypothetical protein